MGQKVNPHGLRVGVIKDWSSRWYSKDETFGDTLVSDYKLRKFLKERLMQPVLVKGRNITIYNSATTLQGKPVVSS